MLGVLQELSAGGHALQNAGFTFFTQWLFDAAEFRYTGHQRSGLVGVERVGNEDPFCFGVSGHGGADVADKVLFRAGVSEGGADHFAGGHLKVRYQRLRPMSGVLEFVQFQLAWGHQRVRVYPLQGLSAGFFINTDNMRARFVQLLCLVIELTCRSDVLPEGDFIFHFVVKPVFDPRRFQIPLILKNARHCWLICFLQFPD